MTSGEEEAVSEIVGYIIMVTIVFIAIGLVFANFIPAADDAEVAEHTKNTQRVFTVLQANIYEIVENEVPSRGAEMRMKGGRLSTELETSRTNVTIDTPVISGDIERFTGTRHVTYETGSGTISYENGAVFRRSGDGRSVMISEPRWRIEEDGPIILPIVMAGGSDTVGGEEVALIEATKNQRVKQFRLDPENATAAQEVELEITSPNADGWNRYFENLEEADVDSFDEDANEVVVTISGIGGRNLIYTETTIRMRIR